MSKYLALDKIKAGDIILSSCWKFSSIFIRAASFSKYSHATIAVSPTIWFEADAQYRCPASRVVWDGNRFRLGHEIPKGYQYTVVRHEEIPDDQRRVDEHEFARRLIGATAKHAFLNYSRLEGFLPLLKLRLGELGVARYLVNILDRSKPSRYSGPFCSSLVASCYIVLYPNLFSTAADRISPRTLGKTKALRPVEGMVFDGSERELPVYFKRPEKHYRDAADSAANFVFLGSDLAALTEAHTQLAETIREILSNIRGNQPIAADSLEKFFKLLQAAAQDDVTKAYIDSSLYTATVGSYEDCKSGCLGRWGASGYKSAESLCEEVCAVTYRCDRRESAELLKCSLPIKIIYPKRNRRYRPGN